MCLGALNLGNASFTHLNLINFFMHECNSKLGVELDNIRKCSTGSLKFDLFRSLSNEAILSPLTKFLIMFVVEDSVTSKLATLVSPFSKPANLHNYNIYIIYCHNQGFSTPHSGPFSRKENQSINKAKTFCFLY